MSFERQESGGSICRCARIRSIVASIPSPMDPFGAAAACKRRGCGSFFRVRHHRKYKEDMVDESGR